MTTPMSLMTYVPKLLHSQFFVSIPFPKTDFSGQTIIVTGSNTGLGLEAARQLVGLKAAKVILAVRTVSKGEAAAADILRTSKATENTVEVWPLDLSNYESIKAFGVRVAGLDRLDAMIQNAGIMSPFNVARVGDDEAHIAVNTIAPILLALFVLPKLRESAKKFGVRTRLSFVGSDLHYIGAVKEANTPGSVLDALKDEKMAKENIGNRYATSKLLLLYAVRDIVARSPLSPESNVIINVMTPGACKSDLSRDDLNIFLRIIQKTLFRAIQRSTEVGGRTLVDAVRTDLDISAHGAYIMDCRVADNGPGVESAKGQALAKRFNEELFARLEIIAPGVTNVLK